MSPYRTPAPPHAPVLEQSRAGLLGLGGLALAVLAVSAARREPDPLADLPACERAALLARTLENLALCERHDDAALRSFCESQAAIARALPECDVDCRSLARGRQPSRDPSSRP